MQHTIEKVGIDAIMDTMTGMYNANTLTVAANEIRVHKSNNNLWLIHTLNTVIYTVVASHSPEMLEDTTVIDYFDRRNGKNSRYSINRPIKKGGTNMSLIDAHCISGGTSEPPLPTKETVLWKGNTENAFTITIPAGVKVLKITTENTYVNEFVDPNLPRYIGVTGGKTYNMRWATVEEVAIPGTNIKCTSIQAGQFF